MEKPSKAKYLVNLISAPGLNPAGMTGVLVEAQGVEEAKEKALNKAPNTGKYKFRTRKMWRVQNVMLLGGIDGSKDSDGR